MIEIIVVIIMSVCVAAICASNPVVICQGAGVCPEEETSSSEVTQQAGDQLYTGMPEESLLLNTCQKSAFFFFLSLSFHI